MAKSQRRMLSASISGSRKLSKVSHFEALLFTWLIPHCDEYGRTEAEPYLVFGNVVPHMGKSIKTVEKSLENLEKVGLILLYSVENDKFLEIINWDDHQNFRNDRPRVMHCPPPPSQNRQVGMTLDIPLTGKAKAEATNLPGNEMKVNEMKRNEERKMLAQNFEVFYGAYPRKVSKQKTLQSWNKIKPDADLQTKILTAVQNHKESEQWTKDDGKFIPHPTTWLNQARWEEVMPKAKVENSGKKAFYNNCPMIKKFGKWYVIETRGEILFTGDEDDIIYK